jgi:hypothetical protein
MSGLTLADLRAQCKLRFDAVNSSYIADSEWTIYINDGGSELHDLICLSDPSAIINKQNYSVVTPTQNYALPDDFYKVMGVYWNQANYRYSLDRTDFHGLGSGSFLDAGILNSGNPYLYALVGNQIYFYPYPTSTSTIELWYFPAYVRLVLDADTVDYPIVNGWEQFIVLTAVIKAKMKAEDDVQAELAEKKELKERIIQMAQARDNFNPLKVRDVYGTTARLRRYNQTNARTFRRRW